MKKLMLLLLATLFIMASCMGRKAQKTKTSIETVTAVSVDSITTVTKKQTTSLENVTGVSSVRLSESMAWKFEAPTDNVPYAGAVWLRMGKDSVDVAKLPKGSKLTVKSTKDSVKTDSLSMIKQLQTVNDSLRTELNKRSDVRHAAESKTSDVERESIGWVSSLIFIVIGIAIYQALPYLWKGIKYLIKKFTL